MLHKWNAEAWASWKDGDGVASKKFEFWVQAAVLPLRSDATSKDMAELMSLVTLRLACSEMSRFATPPRILSVRLTGVKGAPPRKVAKWRDGRFCYGASILAVDKPPSNAVLLDLAEVSEVRS